MAEADDQVLDAAEDSPEDIAAATKLGWTPKEKFRGDPEKWVSAKDFREKADTVMPLLRKQRDELMNEVSDLRQRDAARDAELKAVKAALKAVEDTQEEDLADRVAATKDDLEEQISQASEAGDHRRVAKLTRQMVELEAAERAKPAKAKVDEPPVTEPLRPEFIAWRSENDWFGKDRAKTNMALGIGQAITADGQFKGEAFYAELDRRLDIQFGTGGTQRGGASKVDESTGGGSSGSNGGSEGGVKGYADLPREAKETCDRLAKKMVGEGKAHKDVASWRKSYVRQYSEA